MRLICRGVAQRVIVQAHIILNRFFGFNFISDHSGETITNRCVMP